MALPAVLLLLREAELREHAADELFHKIVDGLRREIKCWNHRHDYRAGFVGAQHILQVHAIEGRFTQAEDERAALLEANVGGAREEVVARAIGDGRERAGGARNYGHRVNGVAAGGDGCADVAIGDEFDLFARRSGDLCGELLGVLRGDAEFLSDEALARFGDDEVDAGDAGVGFEQLESAAGEDCAGGSGDTDGDCLRCVFGHLCGDLSLWRA